MFSSTAHRAGCCCWLLITLLAFSHSAKAGQDEFKQLLHPVFQKNCIKCHGKDGKVKGKVNLLKLQNAADLTKDPELLEKLVEALYFEDMPPEDEPPLAPEIRKRLVAEVKDMLHAAIRSSTFSLRAPIRRMNRFQYSNAVKDLFELKVEVFTLPEKMMREYGNYFQPSIGRMPDLVQVGSRPFAQVMLDKRLAGVAPFPQDLRAEHGFDNRGDHLSLSPLLLESFLKLSQTIVESPDFGLETCGIWNSFFSKPAQRKDAETEVKERLSDFLTRAFRRPVEAKVLDRYAGHVLSRIQSGESFTSSMKVVASAAIASPKFLYLYDLAGATEAVEPLDGFELASRLSFFLWGSLPDQTLLDLAETGKLTDPKILSHQVDRMLGDRRLKRFCDSFPSQWLQLERIISSVPDRQHFPGFYFSDYRVSMHMIMEPLLLFEAILIEDRSILELIDSDFTYRSELLKSAYEDGKKGGKGGRQNGDDKIDKLPFERVKLNDRRHGGVITNAAVMTMTSGSERTKPITRGAWLATVIFNDPPEPPPADVPPLSEKPSIEEATMTFRERLTAHRERADCAGCHEQIDPLGFALENYGPTGKWREEYENGRKVDMSGKLFRKHEFSDIVEFKDVILADKDRFARGFAAHLLSFALAREIGVADSQALDQITVATAEDGYRIRSLLKHIILSEPFLQKSNPKVMMLAAVEEKGNKHSTNE